LASQIEYKNLWAVLGLPNYVCKATVDASDWQRQTALAPGTHKGRGRVSGRSM